MWPSTIATQWRKYYLVSLKLFWNILCIIFNSRMCGTTWVNTYTWKWYALQLFLYLIFCVLYGTIIFRLKGNQSAAHVAVLNPPPKLELHYITINLHWMFSLSKYNIFIIAYVHSSTTCFGLTWPSSDVVLLLKLLYCNFNLVKYGMHHYLQ
jgi:hypothetical protein